MFLLNIYGKLKIEKHSALFGLFNKELFFVIVILIIIYILISDFSICFMWNWHYES